MEHLEARDRPTRDQQRAAIGTFQGLRLDVLAAGPAEAIADLSIACMFEREVSGIALTGGLLQLDQALDGQLTEFRAVGVFKARLLETLLVTRPPPGVAARSVMVVGLGDPDAMSADRMELVVRTAATEATRLRAVTVAFAPNLLDAGFKAVADLQLPERMTLGLLGALVAGTALAERGLAELPSIRSWSFDAGRQHFESATLAFRDALSKANSASAPI